MYPITLLLCKLGECWALCGLSDGVMQCPDEFYDVLGCRDTILVECVTLWGKFEWNICS